ncbi:MAG: tRNA(Met) cytidine acetyltransferase [Pseudomonadales bacterium]|nr:tRNA(Met) cytidine acetyltransferase [Pseudomonadales bacterium]
MANLKPDSLARLSQQQQRGILRIAAASESAAIALWQSLWPTLQQFYALKPDKQPGGLLLQGLSYSDSLFTAVPAHTINQSRRFLGQDARVVLFNAFQGLNPNILAMLTGTVQQGGLLVILTPDDSSWPQFPDPDTYKLTSGFDLSTAISVPRFTQRIIESFAALLDQYFYLSHLSDVPVDFCGSFATSLDTAAASTQQAASLDALLEHLDDATIASASVILGDRGRGKSALLGMLFSALHRQHPGAKIIITAQHQSALQSVFRHCDSQHINICEQAFLPIDQCIMALDQGSQAGFDFLIIDEAASIALQCLDLLSNAAKHIIFATTVAGYEGHGRGFAIKFEQQLAQRYANRLLKLNMSYAFRYRADDALERWINQLCLLKLPETLPRLQQCQQPKFIQLSQSQLSQDESLFAAVFAVLLEAHYQTSADDVRLMLDDSQLKIFVAYHDCLQAETIVAAAVVMAEGCFPQHAIDSFVAQPRRFRGHLLPQQLAMFSDYQWLSLRFWRVMRIATLSAYRRQGLGQAMLGFLKANLTPQGVLGASFAYDPAVLQFWQSCGYQVCQLGSKKESNSGAFTVLVVATDSLQQANLAALWQQHRQALRKALWLRMRYQSDLTPAVFAQLGQQLEFTAAEGFDLCKAEIHQLQRFLQQQATLFQVRAAFTSALLSWCRHPLPPSVAQPSGELSNAPLANLQLEQILQQIFIGNHAASDYYAQLQVDGFKTFQALCRKWLAPRLALFLQQPINDKESTDVISI